MGNQKILVIDNYDSFTYNLVYILRKLKCEVDVFRNDKITVADAAAYSKILLSPGPGIPSESGIMPELIASLFETHPILGVCLGHQAIGEHFGGKLINLSHVFHGVATEVEVTAPSPILANMPDRFEAGRYHSWVVDKAGFPEELEITALEKSGLVMALQHKTLPVYGVQFHPESVLTPAGQTIIENWVNV